MTRPLLLALALLAALLPVAGCRAESRPAGAGEGILVVAIDGLRADHLEAYGYGRETAPTISELASEGYLFTEAYAASSRRLPSHAALLTGCDPLPVQRLIPEGVEESLLEDLAWSWSIPELYPSLAVELLAHGWETAGFFDHRNLTPVRGFRRGFAQFTTTADLGRVYDLDEAGLHVLSDRVLQWLRGLERDRDWFAYVQLDDLERSWSLPASQWERYFRAEADDRVPPAGNTDEVFHAIPRSRWRGVPLSVGEHEAIYDGHVRRLDGELRRLLGGLELLGLDERTTVVVVGGHGVQFGEAGRILASGCYSMADLHVPWVVRPSAALAGRLAPRGTRIDGLTSNIDLAPTVLDVAGVEIPFAMHGRSQVPVLRGDASGVRKECFASLGLLGGWAAIGDRHVVEYLELDRGADAALVRAWTGSLAPGEPAWRTYDRRAERFPGPDYRFELPEVAEVRRLASAGEAWFGRLNDVREILRGSWLDRQVSEGRVRALEEEGWIERAP